MRYNNVNQNSKSITEPTGVRNILTTSINPTTITVTWTEPQCPYGEITRYIMYYRPSDTVQTTNINSSGFMSVDITPETNEMGTQQYNITGLSPDTSYAIHVQAVGMCSRQNCELFGSVEVEVLERSIDDTGKFEKHSKHVIIIIISTM